MGPSPGFGRDRHLQNWGKMVFTLHIFGMRLVTLILDWLLRWGVKTACFIYWDHFTFMGFFLKKWCFCLYKKLDVLKSMVFHIYNHWILGKPHPQYCRRTEGRWWNFHHIYPWPAPRRWRVVVSLSQTSSGEVSKCSELGSHHCFHDDGLSSVTLTFLPQPS